MLVPIYVSPAAAVRAGKAVSGPKSLDLSEEQIADLTEEQREELARVAGLGNGDYSSERIGQEYHDYSLVEPTVEELAKALDHRIERKREEKAKKAARAQEKRAESRERHLEVLRERRTRENEKRYFGLRLEENGSWTVLDPGKHPRTCSGEYQQLKPFWPVGYELPTDEEVTSSPEAQGWLADLEKENEDRKQQAVQKRIEEYEREQAEEKAKEEQEEAFSKALDTFVLHHGSTDQIERLAAGLLPSDEARNLLRNHLFAPLDDFPRYERLKSDDIPHASDEECGYGCDGDLDFGVEDLESLDKEAWERFQVLQTLIPDDAQHDLRLHYGKCEQCDGTVGSRSVLVTIEWHGQNFSR